MDCRVTVWRYAVRGCDEQECSLNCPCCNNNNPVLALCLIRGVPLGDSRVVVSIEGDLPRRPLGYPWQWGGGERGSCRGVNKSLGSDTRPHMASTGNEQPKLVQTRRHSSFHCAGGKHTLCRLLFSRARENAPTQHSSDQKLNCHPNIKGPAVAVCAFQSLPT